MILGRQFRLLQEQGDKSWQEQQYSFLRPQLRPRRPNTTASSLFTTVTPLQAAGRELGKSGFDMKQVSIIGEDYSTEEGGVGFYNARDRMKAWGKTGAFWGGLWGMLFGSALFVMPGVGPLFAAGPLVA